MTNKIPKWLKKGDCLLQFQINMPPAVGYVQGGLYVYKYPARDDGWAECAKDGAAPATWAPLSPLTKLLYGIKEEHLK